MIFTTKKIIFNRVIFGITDGFNPRYGRYPQFAFLLVDLASLTDYRRFENPITFRRCIYKKSG